MEEKVIKCPWCETELNPTNSSPDAEFAAHDDGVIEVQLICNNCGHENVAAYTFIAVSSLEVSDVD